MKIHSALALALLFAAAGASAQTADPAAPPPSTYAAVMALDVPVTAGDITDRPYRVIAEVSNAVQQGRLRRQGLPRAVGRSAGARRRRRDPR
jgi:hypothetical protein